MTMREEKRRRLEARGWKVGGPREFLGLSTEEEAYIELKSRLADAVRQRRQKINLTQVELAKVLRSSQSRVAKIEGGDRSVSLDLLVRSLLVLGASERELAAIIGRSKPAA
jgi:ribosome-binding protein aMBF1 (putative translation factor)